MVVFGRESMPLQAIVGLILALTVGTESFTTPPYDLAATESSVLYDDDSNERAKDTSDLHRERFRPTRNCDLRVYDADKESEIIREWHDLIKNPIDEQTAMTQLLLEACDDDEKELRVMCETFITAKSANLRVPGLTRAECVSVTMYTIEGHGFYRQFNNASAYGVWAPYRVFTSLLFSALKKLAVIEPVDAGTNLYRGMNVACRPPNATRIFWKTFTSTSTDQIVASYFGMSTFYEFQSPATRFGARIKNLSFMAFEDEVLIPPFEVFDYVKAEEQKFYFRTSQKQDLHDQAADLCRSASMLTTFTAVVFAAIPAFRL